MENGWIRLHREIIDWEWYTDINVKITFIHLLLIANHKERQWRGMTIGRGQTFTSVRSLSVALGLTEKKIRNSLKKLEKTQEIATKRANNGTLITLCKYETYQHENSEEGKREGKQRANEGQTRGKQRATNNNDKNDNNVISIKEKSKKEKLHLFKNDPLYNFDNFVEAFQGSKYESADLEFYFESVKNWADSKGVMKKDWAATARNFMLKDLRENKLKTNQNMISNDEYEYRRWLNEQN